MQYITKITSELTASDWDQLSTLFNVSFSRSEHPEWFRQKYRSAVDGVPCTHGMMINDSGEIVGAMTVIPFNYVYFKKPVVFGNLVDLMIHPGYRKDILNFKRIYDKLVSAVKDQVYFVYAVPNPNSFLYFVKVLQWKEIGQLNYYLWPVKISRLLKLPAVADLLFSPVSLVVQQVLFPFSDSVQEAGIEKINDQQYISYRFSSDYNTIIDGGKKAWYRIYDEDGIKTAYIVDADPMEKRWLSKVVRKIAARERQCIDLVMYVSNTHLGIPNLIKTPARFQPRTLTLIGKVLNSQFVDDRIFSMLNWRFNLSDFDVR
jgi:hypothetical protein